MLKNRTAQLHLAVCSLHGPATGDECCDTTHDHALGAKESLLIHEISIVCNKDHRVRLSVCVLLYYSFAASVVRIYTLASMIPIVSVSPVKNCL